MCFLSPIPLAWGGGFGSTAKRIMELKDLIGEDHVLVDLDLGDRREVYQYMVDHLATYDLIPSDLKEEVLKGLEDREAQMSTGIGGGVGLPHAAVKGLPEVVMMVATLKEGVDCEASDGEDVRVFFMILVPFDHYSVHLRTLAMVARSLRGKGVREDLLKVKSGEEVIEILNRKD